MNELPKYNKLATRHRIALAYIADDFKGNDPYEKCTQKMVAQKIVDAPDNNVSNIEDVIELTKTRYRKPGINILEATVKFLVRCSYPTPVSRKFLLRYLQVGDHPNPSKFLKGLGVPGFYPKELPANPSLIGRIPLSTEISVLMSENRILFLHGPSGNGKTAIVEQCVNENKKDFRAIVWLRMGKSHPLGVSPSLTQMVEYIADKLSYIEVKAIPGVYEKLSRLCDEIKKEEVTMIFLFDGVEMSKRDNIDNINTISKQISLIDGCKIIVTSQKSIHPNEHYCKEKYIGGLSQDGGAELLEEYLGEVKVDLATRRTLSAQVGGNPLRLKPVAQMLKNCIPYERIRDMLVSGEGDVFHEAFYDEAWHYVDENTRKVFLAASLFPVSVSHEILEKVTDLGKHFHVALADAMDWSLAVHYSFDTRRISQHQLIHLLAERQLRAPENAALVSELRQNWSKWAVEFSAQFERGVVWNHHHLLNRLEDYDSSDLKTLQSVLHWAKESENCLVYCEIARNLRYYFYTRGDWDAESELSAQRVEFAEERNDWIEKFEALIYCLNVECKRGNSLRVDEIFEKVKSSIKEHDIIELPDLTQVEYRHVKALVERLRANDDWQIKCLELWNENLNWLEQHSTVASRNPEDWIGFDFHFDVTLRYLASQYKVLNDLEEAEKAFDRALAHSKQKGASRGQVWMELERADLHIQKDQFVQAWEILAAQTSEARELKDIAVLARMFLLKGEALHGMRRLGEAHSFYRQAQTYFQDLGNMDQFHEIAGRLKKIDQERSKRSHNHA